MIITVKGLTYAKYSSGGINSDIVYTGGKQLENLSILDTAPTIADLMGLRCPPEWEGKSRAE